MLALLVFTASFPPSYASISHLVLPLQALNFACICYRCFIPALPITAMVLSALDLTPQVRSGDAD